MIQPAGAVHEPKSYTKEGKHGMALGFEVGQGQAQLRCMEGYTTTTNSKQHLNSTGNHSLAVPNSKTT
jgi:hypothetical protein